MTGEYAIFQNYVADFAFGCGYFAVFIYNQFAVGSIECAVAVYEERHAAVFICSTYGQVVFCINRIGINRIGINRIGINRIGINRIGINRIGINRFDPCDITFFVNRYFPKFRRFRTNLAEVALIVSYKQGTISQGCILVIDSLIDRDSADFACGCSYFAVFIYNQFAVGCIECTVTVYEERYSAVFICSTYGQVVFCVQGIGLDRIGPCDITFFVNRYFPKFRRFRANLAVVTLIISYIQGTISQGCVLVRDSMIDRDFADFACGCGYFAVFIYNQFAVGCIECTVAVYEERYSAVFICSTYGQVVFCVQCIGLNRIDPCDIAFFADRYFPKFRRFRANLKW